MTRSISLSPEADRLISAVSVAESRNYSNTILVAVCAYAGSVAAHSEAVREALAALEAVRRG